MQPLINFFKVLINPGPEVLRFALRTLLQYTPP